MRSHRERATFINFINFITFITFITFIALHAPQSSTYRIRPQSSQRAISVPAWVATTVEAMSFM